MRSAAFAYHAPDSLEEALALLAVPGTMALAGGQSLIPSLSDRSIAPAHLVDLGRIGAFRRVEINAEALVLGAMVRLSEVGPAASDAGLPLLAEAVASVASPAIRNRATLVGNLVRASANSELPVAAVALDASLRLRQGDTMRDLPLRNFFLGPGRTALPAGAMVTAVMVPRVAASGHGARCGSAFMEIGIRAGAPPLICVAACLDADAGGILTRVRLVAGGITGVPERCHAAEAALLGQPVDRASACVATARETLTPSAALPESEYAIDVLPVLLARAVVTAIARLATSP